MHYSTKTYPHSAGISCAFRQWRADSHCHFIHGYALAFKFVFAAETLDDRNWVVDFGGLKTLKEQLQAHFDHKTVVAKDDPEIEWFREGHRRRILDLVEVDAVGCEKFAEMAYNIASKFINEQYGSHVRVATVEVAEHESNGAIYTPPL